MGGELGGGEIHGGKIIPVILKAQTGGVNAVSRMTGRWKGQLAVTLRGHSRFARLDMKRKLGANKPYPQ
jgi:hypothetical protein